LNVVPPRFCDMETDHLRFAKCMARVALYDFCRMKKSIFHPIAIALKILYNVNIEHSGHRDPSTF